MLQRLFSGHNVTWTTTKMLFPCLVSTMETPAQCAKYAQSYNVVLVFLLLNLNRFQTLFQCFYCWLWTSKCQLGYKVFHSNGTRGEGYKLGKFFSMKKEKNFFLEISVWQKERLIGTQKSSKFTKRQISGKKSVYLWVKVLMS